MALAVGLLGCGTATRATDPATRATNTGTRAADTTSRTASTASHAVDGVSRATSPTALDAGRFADPYPIDVSRAPGGTPLTAFSGTFDELMVCRGAIAPSCFIPSRIGVTLSPSLSAQLQADGDSVIHEGNHNIFRMPDGEWEMAVRAIVRRGSAEWTLCFHAHPQSGARTDGVPTRWVADRILVGSPTTPQQANYDAKYLDADGQLYLIYSRHLSDPPNGTDGLVAQKMVSPTQRASSAPVTLLAPSGLRSERAVATNPDDTFELVETGNIIKIDSTWVLIYSTGTVNHTDYKIGVAYADSPVPRGGYRKVLIPDPHRVWGSSGDEVDYLLQSQTPGWPHYSRSAVQAPGVGSIVHRGDSWYLFFAGYPPSLRTRQSSSPAKGQVINPTLRIPYYVKLHIAVPTGGHAVATASGEQLSTWITPELGG